MSNPSGNGKSGHPSPSVAPIYFYTFGHLFVLQSPIHWTIHFLLKLSQTNHVLDVKHKLQIRHHLFIERWPGSILVDGARTRTQSTKLEKSLGGND